MNKTSFLLTIIGILFGFTIGFLFANSINRSEIERLKNEIINKPVETKPNENVELTDEQITGAIAKADNEPNNLDLQKNLGLNLYRYANLKQNFKLLPVSTGFLEKSK